MTNLMSAQIPGINVHASPYRDYDVNAIVAIILGLPATDKVIVAGTSLGSNNTPVVAAYVYLQNKKRIIDGIWGFQASKYGEHAGATPSYPGITPNVKFAHLFASDTIIPVPGIGAYVWEKAPGNTVTNLYVTQTGLVHPGDGDPASQNTALAEMKRVVA